jgi:hypothetical protein
VCVFCVSTCICSYLLHLLILLIASLVWGPNLLRPKVETPEFMMSKLDARFVEALLTNYDAVFKS